MPREQVLARTRAPGKLILLGEHAAVYGRTALAVPVQAVEARVKVLPATSVLTIEAHHPPGSGGEPELVEVEAAGAENALAAAVLAALGARRVAGDEACEHLPRWRMLLESSIPVGVGLGSSASVAVALVRAVGVAAGNPFDGPTAARLALEAEKRTHGTPSGIDNTVIALERAIRFDAGAVATVRVAAPFELVVADSGEIGLTREVVASVRARRALDPARCDAWFDRIGRLSQSAVRALAEADLDGLGRLVDENHALLQQLGVSTPRIDRMVAAARAAGALGAKLSGAGGGGVMFALPGRGRTEAVIGALDRAGAARVLRTTVQAAS